jgi:hypothetical protein
MKRSWGHNFKEIEELFYQAQEAYLTQNEEKYNKATAAIYDELDNQYEEDAVIDMDKVNEALEGTTATAYVDQAMQMLEECEGDYRKIVDLKNSTFVEGEGFVDEGDTDRLPTYEDELEVQAERVVDTILEAQPTLYGVAVSESTLRDFKQQLIKAVEYLHTSSEPQFKVRVGELEVIGERYDFDTVNVKVLDDRIPDFDNQILLSANFPRPRGVDAGN